MTQAPIVDEKPAAEWFSISFKGFANAFAMSYGSPVFLCGSALRRARPGDFDVRIIMSDADLTRVFGRNRDRIVDGTGWTERQWRIAREQLKQSRRVSRSLGVNVDIQFQSEEEAAHREGQPRIRLDHATDYDLMAGMGNT